MDTFTVIMLGWGLYSVITYFEKRGQRGKALIATVLVSLAMILTNIYGNIAGVSQMRFGTLILTAGASVLILSFFLFLPVLFRSKK